MSTASTTSERRNPRSVVIALILALTGLVAFGGWQVSELHTASKQRHEGTEVIRAVRAEVLALTNISATTTDEQLKALLGGMTAHLKGEFAPQADAFRQAMVKNKVQSRGRVIAVGLTTISATRATAVVAAAARVSNARTDGDQDRNYRLSLSLKKVDRRWLVNTMEFVS